MTTDETARVFVKYSDKPLAMGTHLRYRSERPPGTVEELHVKDGSSWTANPDVLGAAVRSTAHKVLDARLFSIRQMNRVFSLAGTKATIRYVSRNGLVTARVRYEDAPGCSECVSMSSYERGFRACQFVNRSGDCLSDKEFKSKVQGKAAVYIPIADVPYDDRFAERWKKATGGVYVNPYDVLNPTEHSCKYNSMRGISLLVDVEAAIESMEVEAAALA